MSLRILPYKLQKKAEDDLKESACEVRKYLEHIKEWAEKQPHLKCRLDDQWLISFLRGCKFSLEKTKQKLDYYYTVHSCDLEIFANRDPFHSQIQEYLAAGNIFPLPKCDDVTAPRTILIHTYHYDPEKMTPIQTMRAFFMNIDILLNSDDNFVIAGLQVLINLGAFNYKMLTHLPPSTIYKLADYLLNAYVLRVKGIHIINSPGIFDAVVNTANVLLPEKIKKKIKIHKKEESSSINKYVPLSILPKEYGGSRGTVMELAEQWRIEVESYASWFKEEAIYGIDESKRLNKIKTSFDLLGVDGSFRKLNVD